MSQKLIINLENVLNRNLANGRVENVFIFLGTLSKQSIIMTVIESRCLPTNFKAKLMHIATETKARFYKEITKVTISEENNTIIWWKW